MKSKHQRLRYPIAVLLPFLASVLPLQAQTPAPATTTTTTTTTTASAPEEAVQLPEFSVSAEKADPYRPADVLSVSRIAGSILDAPFSVNVVSRELMNDLGANSGYDVNRYFAGLSGGRAAGLGGIMDRQNFRGFESFSKTVDDFSLFDLPSSNGIQANFDPAFIDRQELVMGPDSILSPTGTPGGSVNILTKSPEFTRGTDITAQVGNYNANKWVLDTTGPISNKLAYRVITVFQDAKTYVPGNVRQQNAGVMLTYKFSDATKLTLKYFGEDWQNRGEITNGNDNGGMVYTPDTIAGAVISPKMEPGFGYRSWNGSASWSRRNDRINTLEAEFTTALFEKVSMRLAAQALSDNFLQDAAYPAVSPGETWDPKTGIVNAVTLPSATSSVGAFNITSMPIVGQYVHGFWRGEQLQNDYAANFHPGFATVQPVVGWTYQQGHQIYSVTGQDNNTLHPGDLPDVNLLANNGRQLTSAAAHPVLAHYTNGYANTPGTGVQKQVYELTKVGLYGDRVFITGGASRTWININNYTTKTFSIVGNGLPHPTGPYTDLILSSKKDTYMAGGMLKPTENSSIYYTFSSNASVTSSPVNLPLWQTGKQHEFGFKTEFFDQRLSINADHFQITEFNLASPNPLFNIDTTQPNKILGNATSKGYELNVVGGVTKNLSVIGSVTSMKYRDLFGRRVRNVPDHIANLLLNYHFSEGELKGAGVFVGVVHMGNVAGETVTGSTSLGVPEQPGFYVDGFTVLNAGASYGWSRYHLNLNVDNVANSKFLWQPASRISVSAYPGLTVRLTANVHI